MKQTMFFILIIVMLLISCGSGESYEEQHCAIAREQCEELAQVDYGYECRVCSNTGCTQDYDNCTEGACWFTDDSGGYTVCTESCTSDSDCPVSIPTCGATTYNNCE